MLAVFRKEFLELIRDRKTLLLTIALPFLMLPLLYGAMAFIGMQTAQQVNSDIQYTVFNADFSPQLTTQLAELNNFSQQDNIALTEVADAILQGELDIAIELQSGEPLIAKLHYDASNAFSDAVRLVEQRIETVNAAHALSTFEQLGYTPEQANLALEHINVERQTVSSNRAIAGSLVGGFVCFLIIVSMLSTAVALGSDLGAGEKERFTLESLLITPQSRLAIAFGKWLTLSCYCIINAALTVLSVVFTVLVITQIVDVPEINQLLSSIPLLSLFFAWLMLLPIAGLISAVMLAASCFASSFKEAQSYGTLVLMAFMFPNILTIQGTLKLEGSIVWTPVINVSLSMINILKGDFQLITLIPVLISNCMVLACALWLTLTLFKREAMMFRG